MRCYGTEAALAVLVIGALFTDHVAFAADWRITPTLYLEETYTDNLRLAPRGQEEKDWVTQVSPGVSISARGARLQLQADYAFQYRLYANNSDENGHNHYLNSNALWDVWNKELFLQASAGISQENLSPLGSVSFSDANVTGNRTEVRHMTVSPYWVRRLGTWANLNARYTWNRLDTSGDFSVYNTEYNAVNVGLSSGPEYGNLGWGINYQLSKRESTESAFEDREFESTVGNLRYKITPTFALTGTLGYEKNDYSDLRRGSTSGTSWSVGGDWAPSSRTRVSGSFGERYFGKTYKLDASHRSRLTTWTLGYSEDVNDEPFLASTPISVDTAASIDRLFLSQIPDPRERQAAVQNFIIRNGLPLTLGSSIPFQTNQVTLTKRLQGGVGVLGQRGTVLFHLFWEERSNLSVSEISGPFDPFAISNTVKQVGYSTTGSWRFSERTAASASLGQTRNRYTDVAREDSDIYVRIGLTHQLQPKVHGAIHFRMVERSSDDVISEYRERAIVGTLRMAF